MNLAYIQVKLIDIDKLNKDIDIMAKAYMDEQGNDTSDLTYNIKGNKLGIISSGNGSHIIVDDELCGEIITDSYEIEIFQSKREKSGSCSFSMFPVLETGIKFSELESKYTSESTENVIQFMGSRYNYNHRIKNNQQEIKNWLNEEK